VVGKNCFKLLRHEAGVHRVQRIPTTDKMNRVHTSTIAIKVVPIFSETEIDLSPKDLEIETMRATGPGKYLVIFVYHLLFFIIIKFIETKIRNRFMSKNVFYHCVLGGQNVNKRESAIRITHLPTNIAVKCDEKKEQEENRKIAMEKLRYKLSEIKYKELRDKEEKIRSNQVKSLLRSEKIRTFNWPQDRITDHRIKKDMSNIKGFFNGNCNQSLSDWLNEMNDILNSRLKEDTLKQLD
jgi:peptide chain release factor 1